MAQQQADALALLGERLDLVYAIDVLHPLARKRREVIAGPRARVAPAAELLKDLGAG